jgi:hypothetical protein
VGHRQVARWVVVAASALVALSLSACSAAPTTSLQGPSSEEPATSAATPTVEEPAVPSAQPASATDIGGVNFPSTFNGLRLVTEDEYSKAYATMIKDSKYKACMSSTGERTLVTNSSEGPLINAFYTDLPAPLSSCPFATVSVQVRPGRTLAGDAILSNPAVDGVYCGKYAQFFCGFEGNGYTIFGGVWSEGDVPGLRTLLKQITVGS